jgi:ABC-type lipoprotein release transport system permease subunit
MYTAMGERAPSTDLVTFVSVSLVLAAVAAVASLIPALRATRVDPVEVLKEE